MKPCDIIKDNMRMLQRWNLKRKGFTQEELAKKLYVTRTAISKWESGRGLPNIDSLKALSKLFNVTIDDLLSSDDILRAAEEEKNQEAFKYGTDYIIRVAKITYKQKA